LRTAQPRRLDLTSLHPNHERFAFLKLPIVIPRKSSQTSNSRTVQRRIPTDPMRYYATSDLHRTGQLDRFLSFATAWKWGTIRLKPPLQ